MDVNDLKAFVAIAEAGGFRAAAVELFVSQPVLSRVIARLENEFGIDLFKRGPRGASLTTQGEALLPGARRMITLADELRNQARSRKSTTFRLGIAPTSAGSYMASFLSGWLPAHPDLRIVLVNDGAGRLRARLEAGDCDAAIVAGPVPDSLESLPIGRVNVRAYSPATHRFAHQEGPLSVLDLDGERLLVNGKPYIATGLLLAACGQVGSQPDIVYESGVSQTLAALAEAGLGIAAFGHSANLRGYDLPNRIIVDGAGVPIGFDLFIAWRRGVLFDPEIMDFIRGISADVESGAIRSRERV